MDAFRVILTKSVAVSKTLAYMPFVVNERHVC